jgi:glyoxylase-like metal-dependent hydrolase (beta-lactamase superfamily II)
MTDASGLPAGAVHIAGDTYYLPGLTNAGFIDGLCIDTGPEPEPYDGVAIDRLAITHGHADHFAVGSVLRDRGATVVAARDDAALVENPDINIRGMFSWAKPGDTLVTKLFLGVPCKVDALIEDWRDRRATPHSLPGHTLGHTAVLTRDGVLFTGDALYEEALWKRHPLPYAIDPDMVARSLVHIRDMEFDWLVPGHGELVDRAQAMRDIDFHLAQIASIQELLLTELRTPRTTEEAIALVSRKRGLSDNPAGYWLAVTTVKGYLGDLLGRGMLEFSVVDHAGVWQTAEGHS